MAFWDRDRRREAAEAVEQEPPREPVPDPEPAPQEDAAGIAAWYPDPWGRARLRYWDGERWTGHTSG